MTLFAASLPVAHALTRFFVRARCCSSPRFRQVASGFGSECLRCSRKQRSSGSCGYRAARRAARSQAGTGAQQRVRGRDARPEPGRVRAVEQRHARSVRRADRNRCRRHRRAGRSGKMGAEGCNHVDLPSAKECQVVQRRAGGRERFRVWLPASCRPEDCIALRQYVRHLLVEWR